MIGTRALIHEHIQHDILGAWHLYMQCKKCHNMKTIDMQVDAMHTLRDMSDITVAGSVQNPCQPYG